MIDQIKSRHASGDLFFVFMALCFFFSFFSRCFHVSGLVRVKVRGVVRVRVFRLVRAACLRVMPSCHETLPFVLAFEFGSFAVASFHFGSFVLEFT